MGLLDRDPSVAYRGGLLPYLVRTVTDPGDDITEYEQLEWAGPGLLYDPMRNMARTGAMLAGAAPVDEGVVTQTIFDAPLIGGLLAGAAGAVPKGAVLGAFAGRGAATADTRALGKAMSMEGRGASRDEIWDETGRMGQHWYKDVDGEWKFEVPDDTAKLSLKPIPSGETPNVSDLLQHPYLFEAYPSPATSYRELADEMRKVGSTIDYYKVTKQNSGKQGYEEFTPEMADELPKLEKRYKDLGRARRNFVQGIGDIDVSGGFSVDARGSYSPNIDTIYNYVDRQTRPDQYKSTQLHELQHAIQEREGFAKGGSPQSMANQVISPAWRRWHDSQDVIEEMRIIKESPEYRKEQRELELVWRKEYAPKLEELEASELKGKTAQEREAYYPLVDKLFADFDAYKAGKEPLYDRLVELSKRHGINANNLNEPKKYVELSEAYRLLAGEAEARNVQTRMDFTPAERAAKPPWTTLDVPEDELIVRKKYGGLLGANKPTAALPGLLDDTASRMQRARDMGFDVDAYHGTDADILRFDPSKEFRGGGVSVAFDPVNAAGYGSAVMPLKVKSADLFNMTKNKDVKKLVDAVKSYHADNLKKSAYADDAQQNFYPYSLDQVLDGIKAGKSNFLELPEVTDILKKLGFKGHIGREGPFAQAKIFNPKNIRSRFAKFDPAKAASADLLAANPATAALPGLLQGTTRQKRRPSGRAARPYPNIWEAI